MKQKIAIIEDERELAEMYQFKLQQNGYEVRYALNGEDGLSLIKEFQPELIMLDLMMPKMSGEELLRRLRGEDWGKNIKVIILTNLNQETVAAELEPLHVDRYVVKADYTPAQVAEMVPAVLTGKQAA